MLLVMNRPNTSDGYVPSPLTDARVAATLECSMNAEPPHSEHQAYYGNRLYTWVFPAASGDPETLQGS